MADSFLVHGPLGDAAEFIVDLADEFVGRRLGLLGMAFGRLHGV